MNVPKYIFQLDKETIAKMIRSGNIKPGRGIKLDFDEHGITISLDTESLKPILWSYIRNATTASNTVSLSDVLTIQVDPKSGKPNETHSTPHS